MIAWWPYGARGMWDQGMVMHALRGELWHTREVFDERLGDPPDDGAVMVVSTQGVLVGRGQGPVRAWLERAPWSLSLLTSDEDSLYDVGGLIPLGGRRAYWRQTPAPAKARGDRAFLVGWPEDTRRLVASYDLRPASERRRFWFCGQAFCDGRLDFVNTFHPVDPLSVLMTNGFTQGLPREEYLRGLAGAAIAPCPSGPCTPDTFRMAEALELGCLPIVERRVSKWPAEHDYWAEHGVPFPKVGRWSEALPLLDLPTVEIQRRANVAGAWWLDHKRSMAWSIVDRARGLAGIDAPLSSPADRVTVLIPTSVVRRHPSTDMIDDTLARIRSYPALADAEVIVMVDGVHQEQEGRRADFEEYKRRLIDRCQRHPGWRGVLPMVFEQHTHQAEMTRRALGLVRTPLVFFVEHDTYPIGDIDFPAILRAFEDPGVNVVRLHLFHTILPEHADLYRERRVIGGAPLIRTCQWSQRPHIARTEWYRKVINSTFAPGSRTMIEDALYGVLMERVRTRDEDLGLWVYAPPGDMTRSGDANGRGGDPKFEMLWRKADGSEVRLGFVPGSSE